MRSDTFLRSLPSRITTTSEDGPEHGGLVQQARLFARGPYAEALQQGDKLPAADFEAIAAKVSAITGLSVEYVKETKLNVSATRFRKELLRDDARTLGRYDARLRGGTRIRQERIRDTIRLTRDCVFMSGVPDYLQKELKYLSQEPYYLHGPGLNENWNFKHRPSGVRELEDGAASKACRMLRSTLGCNSEEPTSAGVFGEWVLRSGYTVFLDRV